jgi:hypothetical protein
MRFDDGQKYLDNVLRNKGVAPVRKQGSIRLQRMNKLERAYMHLLDLRVKAGEIREYKYEAIKLRLADKTFYTPDFLVVTMNGNLELHECKGFPRDDWKVKWKVCIEMYPDFKWVLVKHQKGQWDIKIENPDVMDFAEKYL